MRPFRLLLVLAVSLALSGCHSAFVDVTISNRTAQPISLVEVDYPSASFGTQTLEPGQVFHYRFKILGSGPTTLLWTDDEHREHKSSGPTLHEGQEGTIKITFSPAASPDWSLRLAGR